jgi:hypothetical protein
VRTLRRFDDDDDDDDDDDEGDEYDDGVDRMFGGRYLSPEGSIARTKVRKQFTYMCIPCQFHVTFWYNIIMQLLSYSLSPSLSLSLSMYMNLHMM